MFRTSLKKKPTLVRIIRTGLIMKEQIMKVILSCVPVCLEVNDPKVYFLFTGL